MQNRRLVLAALVLLVLSTIACGGGDGDGDSTFTPTPTPAPTAIPLVKGLEAVDEALADECPSTTACNLNAANCKFGLASCSEAGITLCDSCYPD